MQWKWSPAGVLEVQPDVAHAGVLLGLLHLTVGYILGFINDMSHGVAESHFEHGSWALLMLGFWAWIFSRHGVGSAPEYDGPKRRSSSSLGNGSEAAYELGSRGLPAEVGLYIGIPVAVIGLVTMIYGEVRHYGVLGIIIGGLESFSVLGDVLSYLRIAAVILAKAGMAFVANMLFFGYVVETESGAEWQGTSHAPQYMLEQGTITARGNGGHVQRPAPRRDRHGHHRRVHPRPRPTSSSSCSVSRAPLPAGDPPRVRRILQQVLRGRRPRVQSLLATSARPTTTETTVYVSAHRFRLPSIDEERRRCDIDRERLVGGCGSRLIFDRETSERVTLTRGIGKCNILHAGGSAATRRDSAIWFGKF